MFPNYIIFSILFQNVNPTLLPLPDELSSRISLSKCVSKVVKYLDNGETISVSLSTKPPRFNRPSAVPLDKIVLSDIFEEGKLTVVTEKEGGFVKCEDCLIKLAGYVIQIRELEEIKPVLKTLRTQKHWNPHAYFFVITTSTFNDTNKVLAKIVEELSKVKVINVLIFVPIKLESKIYNVSSWYPYSAGKCGDDYKVKYLGECKDGEMSNENLFKEKIPKNLMGCTLKVRTSIIEPFIVQKDSRSLDLTEGLEIKLMNTIAELRNLTFIYSLTKKPNFYGDYLGKNHFTGSFSDLKNEMVDVLLGYVVSRVETQQVFDPISSYYNDALVLCVPHAEKLRDWTKLTADFDQSVIFTMLIIAIFITILITKISKYQTNEIKRYKQFWMVASNVARCAFAITIKMPKTYKLRLLILCWVVFNFYTQTAYQSTLVSSLTRRRYEKQIKTLEEIIENGLIVLYYPLCRTFYRGLNISSNKPLMTDSCDVIQNCINRTANERNFAICAPKLNVEYLMGNFIDEDSVPKLYCFNEVVASYPIEMLMWKGHPLRDSINELVHRISQSGFFRKWQSDTFYNNTRSFEMKILMDSHQSGLNLNQLGVGFVALLTGLFVSSVVFCLELFWFYKKPKKG
ncbi:glutamate receptor ionotropic, delta-2-like [Onthophagus taurus]|uniref:glutamate receptor ionotropic, delta-2-like n=1 Tax=Onthophagus taurus TaxID=166361 RepID=UPI0039BE0170